MLEHAYYSVISPEGCAGILWRVATETKLRAAEALKLTAKDLHRHGIIDDIIPEPLGGAHRDHREMANSLKTYLLRLRELKPLTTADLLESFAGWASLTERRSDRLDGTALDSSA
jgi:acetyl-CoA carboxylase carboxyl transferase subunit alpha